MAVSPTFASAILCLFALQLCTADPGVHSVSNQGRGLLQTTTKAATAPAPGPASSATSLTNQIVNNVTAGNAAAAGTAINAAASAGQVGAITDAVGTAVSAGYAEIGGAAVNSALSSTNTTQNSIVASAVSNAVNTSVTTTSASTAGKGVSALLGVGQKAIVEAGLILAIQSGQAEAAVLSTNEAILAGNLDSFETCGISPANPYAAAVAYFFPGQPGADPSLAAQGIAAAFEYGSCEVVDAVILQLADAIATSNCTAFNSILVTALNITVVASDASDVSVFASGVAQSQAVTNCALFAVGDNSTTAFTIASSIQTVLQATNLSPPSASTLNSTAQLVQTNVLQTGDFSTQTLLAVSASIARVGCNSNIVSVLNTASTTGTNGTAFTNAITSTSLIYDCLLPITNTTTQNSPVATVALS